MIRMDWNPPARNLRQFAYACPVGFGLIGWLVLRLGGASWWAWAGIAFGILLLAVGLARPLALRPLYVGIMALGAPIGWAVSNLLALVFFFLVLTPIGFFFRLIGRDVLALRARGRPTYWREHRAESDPRGYYRQG
jgi:hypothetical protein